MKSTIKSCLACGVALAAMTSTALLTHASDSTPQERSELSHPSSDQRNLDRERAPVKNVDALAEEMEKESSPLNYFSEESRERFVDSLNFTENGLGGFYTGDLEAELTQSQIHELLSLFGVQYLASSFSNAREEGEEKGENVDHLVVRLHNKHIMAREFNKARKLEALHPGVNFNEIPPIDTSNMGKINLLAISENNDSLVAEPFTLPSGGHVIVVGAPQCNPSNRFFSWLLDSPKFLPVFTDHATAISPVGRGLNVRIVSDFNRTHPVQMKFTYKEKEWPEIRSWSTPSFYFYDNGELVTSFKGWPPEGNVEMLKRSLSSIGLSID